MGTQQTLAVISNRHCWLLWLVSHLLTSKCPVFENCAFLRYYAASSGNFLPTWTLRLRPIGYPETSVKWAHFLPTWTLRMRPRGPEMSVKMTTFLTDLNPEDEAERSWNVGKNLIFLPTWTLRLRPIGCPETSVKMTFLIDLNPEVETDRLSRNAKKLPHTRFVITQKSAFLTYFAAKVWNHA